MIRVLEVPAGEYDAYVLFCKERGRDCPAGKTLLSFYMEERHWQKKVNDYG